LLSDLPVRHLLKLPFFGRISQVSDRGFAFIKTESSKYFIHISNHVGQKLDTLVGLEGRPCAFAIGGDPRRFLEKKQDWSSQGVQWLLFDEEPEEIESFQYTARRVEALWEIKDTDLNNVLSARWYTKKWERSGIPRIEAGLQHDSSLVERVHLYLQASNDLEDLSRRLAHVFTSPWFNSARADASELYKRFFKPDQWEQVPKTLKTVKALSHCKGYHDLDPIWQTGLAQWVRRARVVAIDLETNGEDIYDYGWCRSNDQTGRRLNRQGLDQTNLREAVDSSLSEIERPCIVGHNILEWDWPILERRGIRAPSGAEFWDTLLGSWILEPWRDSHALVVKNRAHTADADAAKCYALFEEQIRQLTPCLEDDSLDIREFAARLLEDPSLLRMIRERNYPASLQETISGPALFPACSLKELMWQKSCFVQLQTAEKQYQDPILDPDLCRQVADPKEPMSCVVAAIVADALTNDVYVHLSWLPRWLVCDELKDQLQKIHDSHDAAKPPAGSKQILIAEDLFKLNEEEKQSWISNLQTIHSPEHIAVAWQRSVREIFRIDQVRDDLHSALSSRQGKTLIAVKRENRPSWLMSAHDPSDSTQPAWYLLPPTPEWLKVKPLADRRISELAVQLPRWRDGEAARLDIERLFVSPDTFNRPLYLADLTHCILNVRRALSNEVFVLVGVVSVREVKRLQETLSHLGMSALPDEYHRTPLRRLEFVSRKSKNIFCCEIENIAGYLQAAQQLNINMQVVISELPVYAWYSILHSPEDHLVHVSSTSDNSIRPEKHKCAPHITLKGNHIRVILGTFLQGWLEGLGLMNLEAPCLILDERISARHVSSVTQITRLDLPFFPLDELLDDQSLKVFNTYCYPRRDVKQIPEDYEIYRRFLETNWGYSDFRRGTQKPAIERLINSDKDLLLRLPTGAGKSIIFHLPALLRSSYSGRVSVVITPLRALMRDQVEGLWKRLFIETVDFLSGGRDPWMNHEVYQGILDGRIQLLFIAPERFKVPKFRDVLERRRRLDGGLEFVVFDEAHCVSEWGFEFRPDYLYSARYVRESFKEDDQAGNPHRLLLTSATITERNRRDLERELGLGAPGEYDDLPRDMPHPIQPFIQIESYDLDESPIDFLSEKFQKICSILSGIDVSKSAALIFVRTRRDCHRLSESLNEEASRPESVINTLRAAPFHAGLSESLKTEACDLLREGVINVLVCTKAFGMGMDIPHIHACIHHKPPTFIEDYLQEVGRMGRDEEARRSAGLEIVTASMLYNGDDIERNISMLYNNTVQPTDLSVFFNHCVSESVYFEAVDQSLCLVPAKISTTDAHEFNEGQVTSSLFWLERMGVLQVEGRHPPVLEMVIHRAVLKQSAQGERFASKVAQLLMEFILESQQIVAPLNQNRDESDRASQPEGVEGAAQSLELKQDTSKSVFRRVVRALSRGIFSLCSQARGKGTAQEPRPRHAHFDLNEDGDEGGATPLPPRSFRSADEETQAIALSARELLERSGAIDNDELHLGLFELVKVGAIELKKTFIVREPERPSGDEYFELIEYSLKWLSASTHNRLEVFTRRSLIDTLKKWYIAFLQSKDQVNGTQQRDLITSKQLEWKISREVHRAVRTSLHIMRKLGYEIKEKFSDNGEAEYARLIPSDLEKRCLEAAEEAVNQITRLRNIIREVQPLQVDEKDSNIVREVPLSHIVEELGNEVRISQLRETMKLLDSSGLYAFESDMDEWVSVVTINRTEPLPNYSPDEDTGLINSTYKEMLDRFDFQVLKAQSMVLLTAMPMSSRQHFIDQYFKRTTTDELTQLIESTIGEIDDEVLQNNDRLQNLLDHVRQKRFTEELERLNDEQLKVCQAPFNLNLLVNAGPGSGKTHVLMMRCAHLIHIQRVDPASILVLAFNRAVVHEIRARIRDLFRDLGYSRYAQKVDVTTFHSFALRFQKPADRFEEDSVQRAISGFAGSLRSSPELAQKIASRYRAILVDEFQDMNRDFFDVVQALISNLNGGGMVIGDDDQDILIWNRIKSQDHELEALYYFNRFRESFTPLEVNLTINYRSTQQIVERATGMISNAARSVGFSRIKEDLELTAFRVETPEDVSCCNLEQIKRGDYLKHIDEAAQRGEHVAILCRSNRECREIYQELILKGPVPEDHIEVLGADDFGLYQLRATGGLLDLCQTREDYEFIETYVWEELMEEFKTKGFADMTANLSYLDRVFQLVRGEKGRPRIRDLKEFILESRSSDVERLGAKAGLIDRRAKVTIATVHKVKGLEYDTVMIMASDQSFPMNRDQSPEVSAAEEARLYYVAMTRAKNSLFLCWGEREKSWWSKREHRDGARSAERRLSGSYKEVYVSYPGQSSPVSGGLQGYIERHVVIGDPLLMRDKGKLYHEGKHIGGLSRRGFDKIQPRYRSANLRVSNIIRYTCGSYFREKNPDFWDRMHPDIKQQRWFYTVLVEEV